MDSDVLVKAMIQFEFGEIKMPDKIGGPKKLISISSPFEIDM
jgi:hypothetical protein